MTAGSASVTIRGTYAWPTLASVFVSASCMSMTSPTAGSMTCASNGSCRSSQGGTTRSASAADAQRHPRTVVDRGRSWSCARTTRRSVSPSACQNCSNPLTVADDRRGEDDDDDDDAVDDDAVDDHHEELVHLLRWLKIDRFDRRAANRELARVATERVA